MNLPLHYCDEWVMTCKLCNPQVPVNSVPQFYRKSLPNGIKHVCVMCMLTEFYFFLGFLLKRPVIQFLKVHSFNTYLNTVTQINF